MNDQSLKFEYTLVIKENHLDTFGHVNNAAYLELLEEARWDFITKNNYGIDVIQKTKKGPVVLAVEMQFKRELKNREKITISSYSFDYKGKIGKIHQTIFNEKGEESCIAVFTFGLFDLALRKLIDPTPEWLKAVGF